MHGPCSWTIVFLFCVHVCLHMQLEWLQLGPAWVLHHVLAKLGQLGGANTPQRSVSMLVAQRSRYKFTLLAFSDIYRESFRPYLDCCFETGIQPLQCACVMNCCLMRAQLPALQNRSSHNQAGSMAGMQRPLLMTHVQNYRSCRECMSIAIGVGRAAVSILGFFFVRKVTCQMIHI